jgi:hypothetical protein
MTSIHTKLKAVAVSVVAAATLTAPAFADHGGTAASHYTPQALSALVLRGEAAARYYGDAAAIRPAASFYTPQALTALGRRGEAMVSSYASRPAPTTVGFEWTDAGVGAGATLGLLLLLAAALGIRPRRSTKLALG